MGPHQHYKDAKSWIVKYSVAALEKIFASILTDQSPKSLSIFEGMPYPHYLAKGVRILSFLLFSS